MHIRTSGGQGLIQQTRERGSTWTGVNIVTWAAVKAKSRFIINPNPNCITKKVICNANDCVLLVRYGGLGFLLVYEQTNLCLCVIESYTAKSTRLHPQREAVLGNARQCDRLPTRTGASCLAALTSEGRMMPVGPCFTQSKQFSGNLYDWRPDRVIAGSGLISPIRCLWREEEACDKNQKRSLFQC